MEIHVVFGVGESSSSYLSARHPESVRSMCETFVLWGSRLTKSGDLPQTASRFNKDMSDRLSLHPLVVTLIPCEAYSWVGDHLEDSGYGSLLRGGAPALTWNGHFQKLHIRMPFFLNPVW